MKSNFVDEGVKASGFLCVGIVALIATHFNPENQHWVFQMMEFIDSPLTLFSLGAATAFSIADSKIEKLNAKVGKFD